MIASYKASARESQAMWFAGRLANQAERLLNSSTTTLSIEASALRQIVKEYDEFIEREEGA